MGPAEQRISDYEEKRWERDKKGAFRPGFVVKYRVRKGKRQTGVVERNGADGVHIKGCATPYHPDYLEVVGIDYSNMNFSFK